MSDVALASEPAQQVHRLFLLYKSFPVFNDLTRIAGRFVLVHFFSRNKPRPHRKFELPQHPKDLLTDYGQ